MSTLERDEKHLTLELGNEEYGIPVRDVREIVGALPATPIPGSSHAVLGVVNLRGKVVPVIDLRLRLGLASIETGPRSCIVVCQGRSGSLVGLLVDSVVEVVTVRAADVEPPPAVAGHEVSGLAKVRDRVVILLDVAATVGGDAQLQAA